MQIKDLPIDIKLIIHINVNLTTEPNQIQLVSKTREISETDLKSIETRFNKRNFKVIEIADTSQLFIDFESEKMKLVAIAIVGEDAYIFEECKLKCIQINDTKVHIIFSEKDGKKLVRRANHRLELGENGVVERLDRKSTEKVKIKDISLSGISFICGRKYNFNIGDIFTISLKDATSDYNLKVQIVRINRKYDKENNLIGCVILKGKENIDKYISKKKIERLKRNGRVFL